MTRNWGLRTLVLVAFAVTCSSCDDGMQRYNLTGVPGSFCIPSTYVGSMPFWMPVDGEESADGFLVLGCWGRGAEGRTCQLPPNVINVGVAPKHEDDGWEWHDFPADSFIRTIVSDPGTRLKSIANDILIVSNLHVWKSYYLWRLHGKRSTDRLHNKGLSGKDALLAVCESTLSDTLSETDAAEGVPKGPAICERRVEAADYTLRYSFHSPNPIPDHLEELDKRILRTIRSWKCKTMR